MRCAIGADQARTIHGKAHRQALDRHVMHDLVIGALQEGRINGREGPHALARQSGGKGHRVLLGNSYVEASLREFLGKFVEAGARWHRPRDRDDPIIARGLVDQRLGIDAGVTGCGGFALGLRARRHIEFDHAMIFVGRRLGRRIAVAFLCHHVNQYGTLLGARADVLQYRQKMVKVMAIDRAHVVEAELFEESAAGNPAAGVFLGLARPIVDRAGHHPCDLLGDLAGPEILARAHQASQRIAH